MSQTIGTAWAVEVDWSHCRDTKGRKARRTSLTHPQWHVEFRNPLPQHQIGLPSILLRTKPKVGHNGHRTSIKCFHTNSNGLQPSSVCLRPSSDGLQPTRDGLQPNRIKSSKKVKWDKEVEGLYVILIMQESSGPGEMHGSAKRNAQVLHHLHLCSGLSTLFNGFFHIQFRFTWSPERTAKGRTAGQSQAKPSGTNHLQPKRTVKQRT